MGPKTYSGKVKKHQHLIGHTIPQLRLRWTQNERKSHEKLYNNDTIPTKKCSPRYSDRNNRQKLHTLLLKYILSNPPLIAVDPAANSKMIYFRHEVMKRNIGNQPILAPTMFVYLITHKKSDLRHKS